MASIDVSTPRQQIIGTVFGKIIGECCSNGGVTIQEETQDTLSAQGGLLQHANSQAKALNEAILLFEGISSTEAFYEHYAEEGKRIGALFSNELLKEDFLRIDFSAVRAAFWTGVFGDRVRKEVE